MRHSTNVSANVHQTDYHASGNKLGVGDSLGMVALFAKNVSMLLVLLVYQVWTLVPYHVRASLMRDFFPV